MTESVYLNELVDIYLGLTHTPEYVLDGVPFLSVKNISSGTIDFSQCNYITEEEYNSLPNGAKPQCGDMLFCRVGTIGKPVIIEEDTPRFGSFVSLGFFRVKDNNLCKLKYLYYWMYSESFYSQVRKNVKGASQVNLNTGWLKNFRLPLYSLATQAEIVQKLEEVDRLITLRQEQLAKLDELIKSRFIELFGEITESVPVSYYIKALTAGKSLAGEEECANKVLKTGAATYDEFDATQVKNLPVDYTPVPEHLLKNGDIIISRMNTAELVGATAYVWRAPRNTYLPDRLWRAELQPDTNAIFVWQMLIQPSTKEQIRREASGTSGSMKNISKSGLLGLQVKKAPFKMQKQFATFVEQTDKSKLVIQQSLEKLETLKKALMQQYFG